MEYILAEFPCRGFDLFIREGIPQKAEARFKEICKGKGRQLTINKTATIEEKKELKVEVFYFFYSQYFNPCLGHQAAVDTDGTIKPCLWSRQVLGNLSRDNLKDMIISGVFDEYWELTKDRIEICRHCEKRFFCSDCRVSCNQVGENPNGKPSYCDYNP